MSSLPAQRSASATTESIAEFIAALPKAELHVHLEGSVEVDTLWELAREQRSPLAAQGRAACAAAYALSDFPTFIEAFKAAVGHLNRPRDYELVAYRALRRLAEQNVRYVEMTISAGVALRRGQNLVDVLCGAREGAARAEQETGIRTQWIFDAVRHWPAEEAWPVVKAAAALRDQGVVAFGLGGDEQRGPAANFREHFEFARQEGLRPLAHAGEIAGPESIWSALQDLGAERIGHGLTAVQDERLMAHLAEQGIPVEICLTSNLRLGGVKRLRDHPARRLFDAGIHISLHSDDPALFGTSINREYLAVHTELGFSREELRQLAANSFQASFLPQAEKQSFLAALSTQSTEEVLPPR